jgi:hypothetical protein
VKENLTLLKVFNMVQSLIAASVRGSTVAVALWLNQTSAACLLAPV